MGIMFAMAGVIFIYECFFENNESYILMIFHLNESSYKKRINRHGVK